jgi:hypothetical protein
LGADLRCAYVLQKHITSHPLTSCLHCGGGVISQSLARERVIEHCEYLLPAAPISMSAEKTDFGKIIKFT